MSRPPIINNGLTWRAIRACPNAAVASDKRVASTTHTHTPQLKLLLPYHGTLHKFPAACPLTPSGPTRANTLEPGLCRRCWTRCMQAWV